tara:strand:- start:2323 stop:2553 length:231 start_codon:yes stop_codon:yes gene_type:complete
MGLFRKIGKAVSGRKTSDISQMSLSEIIDYKGSSVSELAKKSKVSAKTIDKYLEKKLDEIPKGTCTKVKKAFGIIG